MGVIVFTIFEGSKAALRPLVQRHELSERTALWLSGAAAGAVCSLFSTPPGVIKVQLQASLGKASTRVATAHPPMTAWQHTVSTARHTWRSGGVRALYRGYSAQLFCESFGRAAYYLTYEESKRALLRLRSAPYWPTTSDPHHHTLAPAVGVSLPERMLAGCAAGCMGWTVTFPADVIRSRMQAQSPGAELKEHRYRGWVDCLRRSVAEEGISVLWRGLGVTLLRAAPTAMTVLPAFDLVREALADMTHQ